MEKKITVAQLIKKLQELPQDNVISENVINQVKEIVDVESIMNKKVHFTLDVTIPINELVDMNDEYVLENFKEYISDDPLNGILEWMSDGDELHEILFDNYEVKLID